MRPLTIAALPLAVVLLTGLVDAPAASSQPTSASDREAFVPKGSWRVKGYEQFVAADGPTGSLPACEARKGLARDTPAHYFTAKKVKAPLAIHAVQYIVEFAGPGEAAKFALNLAEDVRRKCASAQRRDVTNTQYVHRYHVKPEVQLANAGAPSRDTLAIWSTSYREQLVQAFDSATDRTDPSPPSEFGGLTVVAVGQTGRNVTALMFALEGDHDSSVEGTAEDRSRSDAIALARCVVGVGLQS